MDRRIATVIQTARLAVSTHRRRFDGDDGDVVWLPEAALTDLVSQLAANVGSQIRQVVPFLSRRRASLEFSQRMLRVLASSGATVQRLYLVPAGDASSNDLSQTIADDRERLVDARCLMVGAGLTAEGSSASVAPVAMRDVWLVDDQVVIRQEPGAESPPVWKVSAQPKDVAEAREFWSKAWNSHDTPVVDHELVRLSDPLLESADMINAAAQLSCTRNHVDDVSCGWYHGVWQYLRLFDMVSSPRWHPRFYLDSLHDQIHRRGARRLLISGTADYAVLAFVIAAADELAPQLDIHVVDRCPTPLFACRWYARRFGLTIRVHERDVLADGDIAPRANGRDDFDLVVSDAFLTRFARDKAHQVLQRWATYLRPGGAAITTVRLHPRNGPLHGVARDVSDFQLRLRTHVENWRGQLRIDPDELLDAGREYALKMTSRDHGDVEDIVSQFQCNGFKVERPEVAEVDGELCATSYVRIVATAPGEVVNT